jgi:hypothetical protein
MVADLARAPAEELEHLKELVPTYGQLASSKLNLLQSIVASLLDACVFGPYFFGLDGAQARHLSEAEQLILSTSEFAVVGLAESTRRVC